MSFIYNETIKEKTQTEKHRFFQPIIRGRLDKGNGCKDGVAIQQRAAREMNGDKSKEVRKEQGQR